MGKFFYKQNRKYVNIKLFYKIINFYIFFSLTIFFIIIVTRQNELKYLKGRKYLDALCVYFWATTPIIISIFTFVTYVLIGNELSAATVSLLVN